MSGRTRAYCGGMDNEQAFPVIRQTVLDTTDPRRLAEFYRQWAKPPHDYRMGLSVES